MKTIIISSALLVVCSGCAGNLSVANDQATLSGSPEGLRAMFDGFGGLISDGKASPDRDTAHWVARKEQEKEKTKRHMAPSFLSSLFQRNGASNVTNLDVDTGSNELETFK